MPNTIFQCALAPKLLNFSINEKMYIKPIKIEFYDELNFSTKENSYSQEEFDEIYKVYSINAENSGIAFPRLEINQVIISGDKYKVWRTNKNGQEETLVYNAKTFMGRYILADNKYEVETNYKLELISQKCEFGIPLDKEEETFLNKIKVLEELPKVTQEELLFSVSEEQQVEINNCPCKDNEESANFDFFNY